MSVSEYFISTHGARKGLADTALKTASSGYLTRRLVDVAQDLVVTEEDCGTGEGLAISALIERADVVEPLAARVLGRVVAVDVVDGAGDTVVPAGTMLDESWVERLDSLGVDDIVVRSPITCKTRYGVCSTCYGRDLARGHEVNVGEAVGVIAAQSIGEPGTQLTMRTFHIGGAASRATAVDSIQVAHEGTVRMHNLKPSSAKPAEIVACPLRELAISDEARAKGNATRLPSRRRDLGGQGAPRRAVRSSPVGSATRTPSSRARAASLRRHGRGSVHQPPTDDITGLPSVTVIDSNERVSAGRELHPEVKLVDDAGEVVNIAGSDIPARYLLPDKAMLNLEDSDHLGVGDVIAKIPQASSTTRDITGGLPRVADLFSGKPGRGLLPRSRARSASARKPRANGAWS